MMTDHFESLDFGRDQEEFWPDMPSTQITDATGKNLLVAELMRLRSLGVTTQMAADYLGGPRGTVRNWVQGRHLPPDWISAVIVEKLRSMKVKVTVS